MLGIGIPLLIYVHTLSCTTSLSYWDYSAKDQEPHTLVEVVGVMARIPSCPAMLGRWTLLMSGLGPHSG
jgi:hypothetical protein